MNFYATESWDGHVNGTTAYAFPTKRLRDYMCEHVEYLVPCGAALGRKVMDKDEQNGPWGDWNGYSFMDMRDGHFWLYELEPLWDRTHELGLWK